MKDAYSYPKYCDVAYNWDRKPECDFIEECIKRYSGVKAGSILDIACGTGIHLRELARRGYDVMGLDSSEEMSAFVVQKAEAEGLKVKCIRTGMEKFRLDRKFGCAICLLDSFRYLLTDGAIISHLKSVASALEEDGLYILDLWMPGGVPPKGGRITEWEDISWTQQEKDIRVEAKYVQHPETFDEKEKTFEDELILKVKSPDLNSTIRSRVKTRALFYEGFKDLIAGSGFFDLAGRFYNFDFGLKEGYNIKPIRTNIILKRKRG
jgi:SAM-dependent methyltransferase